jgi:hypothetical protein
VMAELYKLIRVKLDIQVKFNTAIKEVVLR